MKNINTDYVGRTRHNTEPTKAGTLVMESRQDICNVGISPVRTISNNTNSPFTKRKNDMILRRLTLIILLLSFISLLSAQLLTEGFEGNWPPAGWQIINAGSGNIWTQLISATQSSQGEACMRYRYHNSQAADTWALSSGISMIAGRNYRVEFDQKVESSSYPERMKVTIGTAQTIAAQTYTLLDFLDPGLTNETYINRVSPEFSCAQSGTYYLGFNCYSRRDMYYLYIDNIRVYETIIGEVPSPAVCVSPLDGANSVMIDASISWEPESGDVSGYRINMWSENPLVTIFENFNAGLTTIITPENLEYNTTYHWQIIPYNESGSALDCPVWTYTTGPDPSVSNYTYSESFNSIIPPYGWHAAPLTGTRNWSYSTSTTAFPQQPPHSGDGMACYNISDAGIGASAKLVTPPLSANTEFYSYDLQLWMLRELILADYADRIQIYYSATPNLWNNPTLLSTIHRCMHLSPVSEASEGWHNVTLTNLPFTTGNNNFIIIEAIGENGNSIYVDDFQISRHLLPAPPLPCAAMEPLDTSNNIALDTSLSWQPSEGDILGFRISLGTNNPPSNILNNIDLGYVTTYQHQENLLPDTTYYWTIVPYNNAGDALNCPVSTFTTIPNPPISNFPYHVDFSQFLPDGWNLEGAGISNWTLLQSSSTGGESPEAELNWFPRFEGISRLLSPPLNTTGMASLHLSFKTLFSFYTGDYEIGLATRHAGGEWTEIWSHSNSNLDATEVILNIDNTDIGYSNTQVCFFASGDSFNMNYWRLDDILFGNSALTSPQNIRISNAVNGIELSWDAVPDASGYNVWRSNSPEAPFDPDTQINWQKITVSPIEDTSLIIQPEFEKVFFLITAIE